MQCPACKEIGKDKVIDSRVTEGGAVIRRRRQCLVCDRRFTTKERVEEELRLTVVKRDGSRVPYERDKIIRGVRHACYKLPIQEESLEQFVDAVEGDVFQNHDREVASERIGEYVVRRLRALNAVAYVRFMSVYHQYRDIAEFIDEIQNVKEIVATQMPDQASLFEG